MAEPLVCVFSLDHRHAPVDVRERLAIPATEQPAVVAAATALPGCGEAVLLSTCNRVELYLAGQPDRSSALRLLAERSGLRLDQLEKHGVWHTGRACVRQLFRVVASLESLVIGEYQIVNQVKNAYEASREAGRTGALLNPLFQRALHVAGAVRAGTAIGSHKLSIASVAVDLAKQIHGDLGNARLLVIGAGEIAELAVTHLVAAGVRQLSIVNRSQERALALAGTTPARVYPWEQLRDAMAAHDIIIASTSAPHAVVTMADAKAAVRGRRAPLMLIDLAVPRDVEPAIAELEDVYLYNVDHLDSVVAANKGLRSEEVAAASALVDAQVSDYLTVQDQGRNALLAQVAAHLSDVVAAEEARLLAKLPGVDRQELRYALDRLSGKLLHPVLRYLREHTDDPQAEQTVREMLGIDSRPS